MLQVLFNGDNSPGVSRRLNNGFFINRLKSRHIHYPAIYTLPLKVVSRFQSCGDQNTNGNDSDISSLPHRHRFPQIKAVVIAINQWYFGTAQPDIEGTEAGSGRSYCLDSFNSIRRDDNGKTRQGTN